MSNFSNRTFFDNIYEKYSFVTDTPLFGIILKLIIIDPLYISLIIICSEEMLILPDLLNNFAMSSLKLFSNITLFSLPLVPAIS